MEIATSKRVARRRSFHSRLPLAALSLLAVVFRFTPSSDAQNQPEKADVVAALGSENNPIRCDDPEGERKYLARLIPKGADASRPGTFPNWSRLASVGGSPVPGHQGHIIDLYQSTEGEKLYLDMYHPNFAEILAPPGYRIYVEWSNRFEYVNGLVHKLGEKEPLDGLIDGPSFVPYLDDDEEEKKSKAQDPWTVKAQVKKGKIVGELQIFRGNGDLQRSAEYGGEENRIHGKETWYRENGDTWAIFRYKNGERHGKYSFYGEDGEVSDSGEYEDGRLVKEKEAEPADAAVEADK